MDGSHSISVCLSLSHKFLHVMRGATFLPVPPSALPLSQLRIHPIPRSGFPLSFTALSLSHKYPQIINLVVPLVPLLSPPHYWISLNLVIGFLFISISLSLPRTRRFFVSRSAPSSFESRLLCCTHTLFPVPLLVFPFCPLSSLFLFPISSGNISESHRRFIPSTFLFSLLLQTISSCPVVSYFPIRPFLPFSLPQALTTFPVE